MNRIAIFLRGPAGAGLGRRHIAAVAAILLVAAAALLAMGRPPICTCGTIKLWHGAVQSAENSQHIADWYSASHVVHGILFYFAGWLLLRSRPWGDRLVVAVALEAGWELIENSPWVIDRYRAATIALGYTGDSVLNSLCDVGFMILGFALARRLPVWATIALQVTLELAALYAIRDNLALNVLMLMWPVEAVKMWQGS